MPQRYAISFKKAKILPKTCHSFLVCCLQDCLINVKKRQKKYKSVSILEYFFKKNIKKFERMKNNCIFATNKT